MGSSWRYLPQAGLLPGPVSLKCQATGFVRSWPSWALEGTGCRQPGCAPCSRRSRRLRDATLDALNLLSVRQPLRCRRPSNGDVYEVLASLRR